METIIDFSSSISVKISASEAIKRITNIPEWWDITFSGSAQAQNDEFVVKMEGILSSTL